MSNIYKDPELNVAQDAFEEAVQIRKWSMIRERTIPRIMPPLAVTSVFATSLFVDVWSHLPPQGRMVGMIAFLGAMAASPFINRKSGSPIVKDQDAVQAIDQDINGKGYKPASEFSDTSDHADSPLWEAGKKQIWDKWGSKLLAQDRKSGFEAYYGGEHKSRAAGHIAIACAAALSGVLYGENLRENFATAMDWTVPIPPLVYTATISPPTAIASLETYNDDYLKQAIQTGQTISAHEQSVLTLIAEDRPASIIINGQTDTPVESYTLEEIGRLQRYIYEIVLDETIESIQIEDSLLQMTVRQDANPSITITGSNPDIDVPTSLSLRYTITDDTGTKEASGRLQIPAQDGQGRDPVLQSNTLPQIVLPFE